MQRGLYDTVTREFRVPVLIPAKPSERDGYATFFRQLSQPTPVRVFRDSDLRNAHKHLTSDEALHFAAVLNLTTALQNPSDPIALRKAEERFKQAYAGKRSEPTELYQRLINDEQFLDEVKKNTHLSPQETIEFFAGRRPSPHAASDKRWLLSEEISEMLNAYSQLVLWWTGKRFTPAIWCEDIKTAFYVRALLNVVGGRGLRVCPHCSEVFLQERPDQNYCSVAHREAHRVARWRAIKQSKSSSKRR